MKRKAEAALAAGLLVITTAGSVIARWALEPLGCHGDIKHMHGCMMGAFDVTGAVAIGLFWFPIMSVLLIPICIWKVGKWIEEILEQRKP